MRVYSEEILQDIRDEINFIWMCHEVHDLEGYMRLYAPVSQEYWLAHEPGFEIWFGNDEESIERAIKKLTIFYQDAKAPNTPFFLDPLVCAPDDVGRMVPVGTGVVWSTILCKSDDIIRQRQIKRIKDLGVYMIPLVNSEGFKAGFKILGFLKEPFKAEPKHMSPDGSSFRGVRALAEIFDLRSDERCFQNYMVSGVEYRSPEDGIYQQEKFSDILEIVGTGEHEDSIGLDGIKEKGVFIEYLVDAAICWNRYDRVQYLYERYGVDVANLESNLKKKAETEAKLESLKKEWLLIFAANKKHNLKGEMRLYTPPNQQAWRSKEPAFEVWFDENDFEGPIEAMELHYNAGMFPNSPLLFDPVVYVKDPDGVRVPLGCSVIWTTAFSTGQEIYNPESEIRIKQLGFATGDFIRAGDNVSGVKALGFRDEPYLFDEEFKNNYRTKYGDMIRNKMEEKRQIEAGEIEEDASDKPWVESNPEGDGTDKLSISGCKELFNIANVNGDGFEEYYLLTSIEYLCTNGAFASDIFDFPDIDDDQGRLDMIEKYTVSLDRVNDALKCWEGYGRIHLLWDRFGSDASKLEENLKFYNLCGRDLDLLAMVGGSNEDKEDEEIEFLVPSWLPKSTVTLISSSGGTGRSTLIHRLAIAVATDYADEESAPKWLGSEIDKEQCKGMVVYFAGEDTEAVVTARSRMLDVDGRANRIMLKCGADFDKKPDGSPTDIIDFFEKLEILPEIALVIIDPAKKYITGNEDDNDAVKDFIEAAENFAVKKKCAVLIAHGLKKEAHPKEVRDMVDYLRGSEEFAERPRLIIGFMREDTKVMAGFAKNGMPPGLGMVDGERIFVRDPEALDLVWLPGEDGVRHTTVSGAELEKIKEESKVSDEGR